MNREPSIGATGAEATVPKTNAVARSLILIDASVFEQRYLVALLENMPCHDVDVVLLSTQMSSSSFWDVRCL